MLFAVLHVGCSKKGGETGKEGEETPISDGWELTSWGESSALAGRIYLQFEGDRFTLYQQIGDLATAGYKQYTGTYTVTVDSRGEVLSGRYSDGTPWLRSYLVELRTDAELRLRSLDEEIVSVYASVVIPVYVKMAPAPIPASSRGKIPGQPFL